MRRHLSLLFFALSILFVMPGTVSAATYYTVTIRDTKNTSSTSDDTTYQTKVKAGQRLSSSQLSSISSWIRGSAQTTFNKLRSKNTLAAAAYYYGYYRTLPSYVRSSRIKRNAVIKVNYKRRYVEDYVRFAYYLSKDKRVGYQTPTNRFFQLNKSGQKWDVDCASFVFYALYYAGYLPRTDARWAFGTDEEAAVLKANGFREVPISSRKRGDVLLVTRYERSSAYGHTAIYIGDGLLIDASGNKDGRPGDSSGKEVAIRYYQSDKFKHCFRLIDKSRVVPAKMPQYALLSTQSARKATIG